jgi:hypothetical protein
MQNSVTQNTEFSNREIQASRKKTVINMDEKKQRSSIKGHWHWLSCMSLPDFNFPIPESEHQNRNNSVEYLESFVT